MQENKFGSAVCALAKGSGVNELRVICNCYSLL